MSGWARRDEKGDKPGARITKRFKFKDFVAAMAFLDKMAVIAEATSSLPMPTGFWVMAPAITPLLIASIWALPESKPTIVMPFLPLSWTPLTMPMAEPSLAP